VRDGDQPFPFTGYHDVLREVAGRLRRADPRRVLDLGVGTGNLAELVIAGNPDIELWGVDFSAAMLERARAKLPAARLLRADLREDVAGLELPRFDAIGATYVLHEFDDARKLELVSHLIRSHLTVGGVLVAGDIGFETVVQRELARRHLAGRWDPDEHYFAADAFVALLQAAGLRSEYLQVSPCAGVFTIRSG
jgi:putative AdoMet-dependent methyltransferase